MNTSAVTHHHRDPRSPTAVETALVRVARASLAEHPRGGCGPVATGHGDHPGPNEKAEATA